jgi:nucleotide-binding universal stress UspA family protein
METESFYKKDVTGRTLNSTILVPVDFSPESIHALRYARRIASQLGLGITIVHIHQPIPDPITKALREELLQQDRDKLDKMLFEIAWDQVHTGKFVPVNTDFEIGETTTTLLSLMEEERFDMMVMSTRDQSILAKRIQGSVSTMVSRQSAKPVIVVPIDAALKFPENILIGLSEELINSHGLEDVLKLAIAPTVTFHFIYCSNDIIEFNRVQDLLTTRLAEIDKSDLHYTIDRIPISSKTVEEALAEVAETQPTDMMIVATHHRSLIEGIGHHSISKKILLHPGLPIMIVHSQHEKGLGITDYLYDIIKEG